jgi:hypothetical protein
MRRAESDVIATPAAVGVLIHGTSSSVSARLSVSSPRRCHHLRL